MNSYKTLGMLIMTMILLHNAAYADGLTFGLVAKSVDDGNFVDAWRGCEEEAKRFGDECVLLGGKGAAHLRHQMKAVQEAVQSDRFDALAISVIRSDMIAEELRNVKIPIITYDSPFEARDNHVSRAYIGTDNVAFGRDLAKIAKQLRPQGGTICLMTAMHDPNLAQRVEGVRQELSGNDEFPEGQRLSGEGGWREMSRSPWDASDTIERTMEELTLTLEDLQPDIFLSVGHWPVVDSAAYRKTVEPFREDLITKKQMVIVAVGKILPEFAALMDEKLVHGYVSINFPEIGRLCYEAMKAAVEGKSVPPVTYTPNTIRIGE